MLVIVAEPPLMDEIAAVFPVRERPGVIFAWGDRIYNPSGKPLPASIIAHEKIHLTQQAPSEDAVIAWWKRYLVDPAFRFDQEIPAHRAEYREYCRHDKSREGRNWMARHIAGKLSGELYGKLCSFNEALKLIKAP